MSRMRLSRRRFLTRAGTTGAFLLLSRSALAEKRTQNPVGLDTTNRYPDTQATVTIRRPEEIRLLQFTDLHFFNNRDRDGSAADDRTVAEIRRMVDRFEPDLVAVTGDLWHENPGGRGEQFLAFGLEQIEALGVPWLFTWGNHDELSDYVAGHHALTTAKHSRYRGGPQGGNYTVQLIDASSRPLWELLCLNTTNMGLQRRQREWLDTERARRQKAQQPPVPAFALFHIPLLQYHYLWEEEMASGLKREGVCSDGENGGGVWHLQQWGTVRAAFCGHDHVNDYSGLLEGVELAYGRATGHAGYGGADVRKGAKLITIDASAGAYTWQTVFPDGSRWRPDPGFRTNEVVDTYWMRHTPA